MSLRIRREFVSIVDFTCGEVSNLAEKEHNPDVLNLRVGKDASML